MISSGSGEAKGFVSGSFSGSACGMGSFGWLFWLSSWGGLSLAKGFCGGVVPDAFASSLWVLSVKGFCPLVWTTSVSSCVSS